MFRFETLLIAVLLGTPVAALWLRGDFTDADVWWRFGLCWLVAWAAVSLLSAAARPLPSTNPDEDEDDEAEGDEADGSERTDASGNPADTTGSSS